MAANKKTNSSELVIRSHWSYKPKPINESVVALKQNKWARPEPKNNKVATAGEGQTKSLRNRQSTPVTLYRRINRIFVVQNPYNSSDLQRMEAAVRRSHPVRVCLWIKERAAFTKSKLVIDLNPVDKIGLTDQEIK